MEELSSIATFTEDWNPEAVKQALDELAARGLSQDEIDKISSKLKSLRIQKEKREAKERSKESYTVFDFIIMFIFIPRTLFSDWFLKKEGYHTMHKQRLYLIGFTFLFWTITIASTWNKPSRSERLWQNEVNSADIYEWEKDNYSDEEIVDLRKESIEQIIATVRTNSSRGIPTYVILEKDTILNSEVEQLRNLNMLNIRDVTFEGDFEPKPYEWITIKLVN